MLVTAITRSLGQFDDPVFRRLFFLGLVVSAAVLGGTLYAGWVFWPADYKSGYEWIDAGGYVAVSLLSIWFLFPAIAVTVMSLFADQVCTAVEKRHYPARVGPRPVGIPETVWASLKLMALMVLLNLLAFVPYMILLFSTGGLGTLALYLAINGFLLSREYYDLVIQRHAGPRAATAFRKRAGGSIFLGGVAIAGLFIVPIFNILAPILGAALMTHIVQMLAERDGGMPSAEA